VELFLKSRAKREIPTGLEKLHRAHRLQDHFRG
jgi:hypothetical protein